MDEQIDPLLLLLEAIPPLSWEIPEVLKQLNGAGLTLGELAAELETLERAIEQTDRYCIESQLVCRQLATLPPTPLVKGISSGF